MRDRDGCSALCRHVQRALDHFLRLRVEGRGRLVEQEDLWVAEKGTGDGDTLFLAAGEEGGFAAAFGGEAIAREGVSGGNSLRNERQAGLEKGQEFEDLRQRHNKVVDVSVLAGLDNALV
jgi:hypothetical protein